MLSLAPFENIPVIGRLWDSLQGDGIKCNLPSVGTFFLWQNTCVKNGCFSSCCVLKLMSEFSSTADQPLQMKINGV